jgi:hypothetical protein
MILGPHVGAQHPCMYLEGTQRYKGQTELHTQTHAYTHTQHTHSGGRVLRSGGLNHYNPSCALVFIPNPPNRQTA